SALRPHSCLGLCSFTSIARFTCAIPCCPMRYCPRTGSGRLPMISVGSYTDVCFVPPSATSRRRRAPLPARCRLHQKRRAAASAAKSRQTSDRILKAEGLALIVIREGFRVTTPANDGAQRLFGSIFGHMILELVEN